MDWSLTADSVQLALLNLSSLDPKMDQAQTRALSALQPFIHLALTTSSPTPRFLADLITRATSAPGTYIFTELLQTPAIQSLRSADTPPEFQAYLTVLEIFSYGTFEEYKSMIPSFLPSFDNSTNPNDSHTQASCPKRPSSPQTPPTDPSLLRLLFNRTHLRQPHYSAIPSNTAVFGDPHHIIYLRRSPHCPPLSRFHATNRPHHLRCSPPRPSPPIPPTNARHSRRVGTALPIYDLRP